MACLVVLSLGQWQAPAQCWLGEKGGDSRDCGARWVKGAWALAGCGAWICCGRFQGAPLEFRGAPSELAHSLVR